jgi:hypothetical protein
LRIRYAITAEPSSQTRSTYNPTRTSAAITSSLERNRYAWPTCTGTPRGPPRCSDFRITTPDNGTGTLDGNFSFAGGDGGQFLIFGDFGQPTSRTINITGNVEVEMGPGGGAAGPPDAVATVGTGPNNSVLNVGGNVSVRNSTVLALSGSIGGNLSSDSSAKAADELVILGNYANPFSVGKNVHVITGDGADEVDLQATDIKGNLSIATRGGDDFIYLGADTGHVVTTPSRTGKNVVVDAGPGDDEVKFDGFFADKHIDLVNVETVI